MKRNLFFTSLLIAISLFVYGQSNDQKSVRQMLDKITNSMKKHDIASLEPVYSSDFVFVNANGKKYNRSERIANLKSLPAPEEFEFKNEKIRIYGNTAVVNAEVKIKPKGQALQNNYATIIFVKENGQWKEVYAQGTTRTD